MVTLGDEIKVEIHAAPGSPKHCPVTTRPADFGWLEASLMRDALAGHDFAELLHLQRCLGLASVLLDLDMAGEPVADALSSDGTALVGVGCPGEPAPHVGALRAYLPQTDWKPQVRELIEGARHVVPALGWGVQAPGVPV